MPLLREHRDCERAAALSGASRRKGHDPWGRQLGALLRPHRDLVSIIALALLGAVIFLPRLSSYPLWDPWEPHYSQVAWEMQKHETWTDPYYRDVNNWWSKPIFMLWLLRASFHCFWDSRNAFAHPEFAARVPFALLAILGGLAQYDWARRLFGRTPALLASTVMMTSAQYVLIGRQVMVDMAMVVTHSAAIGYLAVGLFGTEHESSPERRVWLRQHWPFALFWLLEAIAVLAKGFVPPTLAALTLGAYTLLTFRKPPSQRGVRQSKPQFGRTAVVLVLALALALLWNRTGASSLNPEQQALGKAGLMVSAACLIGFGLLNETALIQHARNVLKQLHSTWGLALFFAVAAPWYVSMTLRHGWSYWSTFIFFHHLGRASGTIHLPASTFDFYLRQWSFGMFPWTGFVIVGIVASLARVGSCNSVTGRRDAFFATQLVVPPVFFMLAGTKFAHYIFPVVPFSALSAALLLTPQQWPRHSRVAHSGAGAYFPTRIAGLVALLATLVLLVDVRRDVRNLLRVFVYYFNRTTPFDYQPAWAFTVIAVPVLLAAGLLALSRRMRPWYSVLAVTGGVAFACYLSWVTMPAMGSTYTYEPVYAAYRRLAKPGQPVGQYCNWAQPERSVLFMSQNQVVHLGTDSAASLFLSRQGRRFIIVDRNRLDDLKRVAGALRIPIHVVFADHAYARLVSTEPSTTQRDIERPHLYGELPAGVTPSEAKFNGNVQLRGWRVEPNEVPLGQSTSVNLYFEALGPIADDWQIKIYVESPIARQPHFQIDHSPPIPTSKWQEGRIVEDTFTVNVPMEFPHESFFVWVGLAKNNELIPLSNSPPNDAHGYVRGPLVFVRPVHRVP